MLSNCAVVASVKVAAVEDISAAAVVVISVAEDINVAPVAVVVVLGFYVPPTAKAIQRRHLGLKSHLT